MYKVLFIKFDFDSDCEPEVSQEYKDKLYADVYDKLWCVEDEEDLVDEITERYGWCVKSIDYEEVEV